MTHTQSQVHVQSRYADKICSLFKQSDCNNVLETPAAKRWGIFGWSEIGLGYFSANILLLLFLPQTLTLIALLNICTLPYSFWSVWYQKTKAKQSSFDESLNSTNKYLIAACLAGMNRVETLHATSLQQQHDTAQIFTDWFEKGRELQDEYFKDMQLNMDNPAIEIEFQKHEAWRTKSQLRATPTVLVNGYKLPENYKIEDLQYFTEFNVDIK